MKVNEQILDQHLDVIAELLNYSFGEVNSYQELTDKEKSIISEETFNKLFRNEDI